MGSHLHMLHLLLSSTQPQNGGNRWSGMTIQTLKMSFNPFGSSYGINPLTFCLFFFF
ncbi:hypothetical protein Gotur_016053, partial [Gossypium turneri]